MAVLRLTTTIPSDTSLPRDAIQNTFHFRSDPIGADPTTADLDAISDAVVAFYDSFVPDWYPSAVVAATGWTNDIYDLGDPEPRVPIRTDVWAPVGLNASPGIPTEVALCLSYHGTITSGVNPARRRGRLYLGPLAVNSLTAGVSGRVRPQIVLVNDLAAAGTGLAGPIVGTVNWFWSVFSPTTYNSTGELDASTTPIVAGWVDSAFDTQRRRGHDASSRTLWSA